MRKLGLLILFMLGMPLAGCGAIVTGVALLDAAGVDYNTNQNTGSHGPYCTYRVDTHIYQSRPCPPGVAAGTNFTEMRSQPR